MTPTKPLIVAALLASLPLAACAGGNPAATPSAAPTASAAPPSAPTMAPTAAPTAVPAAAFAPIDEEGCEHLAEGPATAITAAASAGTTAPAVAIDHHRYDVTVPAAGGYVKFQSAEATEFVFFTNPTATLAITDATGQAVALTSSATGSAACADIKGRYTARLGVGVYYLQVQGATQVSIVAEEADGEEGHDHDEE